MDDIADLRVDHKQGKQELSSMMERLRSIRARFDGELDLLGQNAEWDKFTIAFFGETNAGKSTILESLRIMFDEELRQQLLRDNKGTIVGYEQALDDHVARVREGLGLIYAEYAGEIEAIRASAAALRGIVREESDARVKRKLLLAAVTGLAFGGGVCGVLVHFLRL
ncbi:hypothetical protein DKG74_13900 [Zavarzinia aquatilis]|uniref:G domain-containing protein n=2 Tax=Zavarzinia aquatilis TaxID=2211142 RepID=A0A317E4K8_9PROT|nr:hypothetical protein DKG74_13900 [Zavarzinia aquatilis]